MFGALVSAGAALLGGVFSMSSEKKRDKKNAEAAAAANTRNRVAVDTMNADVRRRAEAAAAVPIVTNSQTSGSVDVQAMMAGAEAAGFNPVTWLRNGGMQAYARTSSSQQVWNSQLMDAALAGSSIFQEGAPPLATARGVGEVIGSALTTGASQWVHEAEQERQNQFQVGLLAMQLAGANRNGTGTGYSGSVPAAYLGGSHTTARNSAALDEGSLKNPYKAWSWLIDNDPTSDTFGQVIKQPSKDASDLEQIVFPSFGTRRDPKTGKEIPYVPKWLTQIETSIDTSLKSAPRPRGPNAPPDWWTFDYWR